MKRQGENGSLAVEFAIMLPIFLVLVAGVIEFGFALVNQEVLTNASREAARAGIIASLPKPTATDIKNVADTYLTNAGLNAGIATVTVIGEGLSFGNNLTVTIAYPYSFRALPDLINGFPGNITLGATVTMKHE